MFKSGANNSDITADGLAPADVPRKLTSRDIALGIGRKATTEELEEYLHRQSGKSIPLHKAIAQIKEGLNKKRKS